MTRKGFRFFIAASVVASAACTVHQTEAPSLAGPSELGRSLSIAASPDQLTQDGYSSSTISIVARDANAQPLSNVQLHLDTIIDNQIVDFGSLSARTVFTNSSGRATVTYTAPLAPPFLAGGPSRVVSIGATPVGTNYSISNWSNRNVELLVTPPPAPVQGPGAPTAVVSYAPASPKVGTVVLFNAAGSFAEAGHQIVSYFWDFGDGQPQDEHGNDASHVYQAAGTYYMVLGVVDDLGRIDSDIKTIVVTN
jgi:PKD repeat protein